jgi:hypothetical protein
LILVGRRIAGVSNAVVVEIRLRGIRSGGAVIASISTSVTIRVSSVRATVRANVAITRRVLKFIGVCFGILWEVVSISTKLLAR